MVAQRGSEQIRLIRLCRGEGTCTFTVLDCTVMYMSKTMTVSEARAALPEILDRVLAGEEVTITRHGKPVAIVVRSDSLIARRADEALASAERLRDLLAQSRSTRLPPRGSLTSKRGEQLIADVRTARAAR